MAIDAPAFTVISTASSILISPSGPITDLPKADALMTVDCSMTSHRTVQKPTAQQRIGGVARDLRLFLLLVLTLCSLSAMAAGPILVVGDSLSAAHNIPQDQGWEIGRASCRERGCQYV